MDATTVIAFLQEWVLVLITIFAAITTVASILLKLCTAYIKSVRDSSPEYSPSLAFIKFMAVLSALAQNSSTIHGLISQKKI